jgi:hypothetical protein
MVGQEVLDGSRSCVVVEEGPMAQRLSLLDKTFDFSHAMAPEVSQQTVYTLSARPLLDRWA